MNSNKKAQMLLPWYVNGKIDYDDERLVEKVLAESPEFRKEYESQMKMAKRIKQDQNILDITVISTQEQRLSQLMSRIHDDRDNQAQKSKSRSKQPRKSWLPNLLPGKARHWAYTGVAMVLVAQLAIIVHLNQSDQVSSEENSFELSGEGAVVNKFEHSLIIEFSPQSSQAEIDALVQSINGVVIEPKDATAGTKKYLVGLKGVKSLQELDELIDILNQKVNLILFVGKGLSTPVR